VISGGCVGRCDAGVQLYDTKKIAQLAYKVADDTASAWGAAGRLEVLTDVPDRRYNVQQCARKGACMPACPPQACMLPCLHAPMLACSHACMLPCLHAPMPACMYGSPASTRGQVGMPSAGPALTARRTNNCQPAGGCVPTTLRVCTGRRPTMEDRHLLLPDLGAFCGLTVGAPPPVSCCWACSLMCGCDLMDGLGCG